MNTVALANDLGLFEGYNFRTQNAITQLVTADEIVNWDCDANGEAEFWPHGDHDGVLAIFKGKSAVSFSELQKLDELLNDLGDDQETFARIAWFQHEGYGLGQLTVNQIEDEMLYIFRGDSYMGLEKEAAFEIFETFFPEEYTVWEKSMCPGFIFDPERFLAGPEFGTMELMIGDDKILIVQAL